MRHFSKTPNVTFTGEFGSEKSALDVLTHMFEREPPARTIWFVSTREHSDQARKNPRARLKERRCGFLTGIEELRFGTLQRDAL